MLALIEGDPDAASLFQVSRAGAAQIVQLPLQPEDLQTALSRILVQFGINQQPSRLLAVTGVAEGCGSTSLAVNLAYEIAETRQTPCVLAELTQAMGRLAVYLNITPSATTHDLLSGKSDLTTMDVRSAMTRFTDRLHVLAGPYRTVELLRAPAQRVVYLSRLLRTCSTVTVVDMPYTFDELYFETLAVADAVVVVAQQNVPAVGALTLLRDTLRQRNPGLAMFPVINRFQPSLPEFSLRRLRDLLHEPNLLTVAEDGEGFRTALNNGQPLRVAASRSRALADIDRLASALLGNPPGAGAAQSTWLSRIRRLVGLG